MRWHLMVAAVAATLGIAACGGDDSRASGPQTAADPPATMAQFLAQGDELCRDANNDLAELARKVDRLTRQDTEATARLAKYLRKAARITRSHVRRLARLRAPQDAAGRYKKLLAAYRHHATLIDKQAAALESGDLRAMAGVSRRMERNKARSHGLAQGMGFEYCGSGAPG